MKRLSSPAARRRQREAIAESESRAAAGKAAALEAAWQALGSVVTPDVLAAVRAGQIGRMRDLLRRPPAAAVLDAVRNVARRGWAAGLQDGKRSIGEKFDDPGRDTRAAALRARRERAETYRATGPEMRQARQQAKEFLRSFMRHVREQTATDMRADPEDAARNLTTLKVEYRRAVEQRAGDVLETPLRDVDWQTSRRGEATVWSLADKVVLVEFVATNDDETTPACQFLDGGLLESDDRRVFEFTPGLHWRCRSMFVARPGTRRDVSWDRKVTKSIGEPNAGATTRRTYTLRPSQIRIPAGAPNVPPPDSLAEWVG